MSNSEKGVDRKAFMKLVALGAGSACFAARTPWALAQRIGAEPRSPIYLALHRVTCCRHGPCSDKDLTKPWDCELSFALAP